MTDLTPTLNNLLSKQGSSIPQTRKPCTETADEFLKEAYRIVSHALYTQTPAKQKEPLTQVHLELTHPFPPPIPPINPPRLPLNNPTTTPPKHNNPQPQKCTPNRQHPNKPHRPRTRRSRHINSPPPPRPSNLNRKPFFRRIPPPRNILHPPPQEIWPLRRRRPPLALGRRGRCTRQLQRRERG